MTFVKRNTFAIQKKILFLSGLWQTSSDKTRIFRIMFVYVMYLSNITIQCLWLFEFDCNLNCILYILAILMQNGIGFVKYMTIHRHIAAVQSLYAEIDQDWKHMANDEICLDILLRNAAIVRYTVMGLIVLLHFYASSIFLLTLILPSSRPATVNCTKFWERPIVMEDPYRQMCRPYMFILTGLTYFNVAMIITAESTFMTFSEHVCVMLKLAGYHLKHATVQNVYQKTLLAVHAHMRALKFMKKIWNIFSPSYTLLIFFGIVSASAGIMSLRGAIMEWTDVRFILLFFSYPFTITLYGVMTTYFGQRVIDHSSDVFHDAYNSRWYEFPLNAQKFYFIVMERSIRSCSYAKRGIFISSLEGLTSLVNATFSYAAVFLSIRN